MFYSDMVLHDRKTWIGYFAYLLGNERAIVQKKLNDRIYEHAHTFYAKRPHSYWRNDRSMSASFNILCAAYALKKITLDIMDYQEYLNPSATPISESIGYKETREKMCDYESILKGFSSSKAVLMCNKASIFDDTEVSVMGIPRPSLHQECIRLEKSIKSYLVTPTKVIPFQYSLRAITLKLDSLIKIKEKK